MKAGIKTSYKKTHFSSIEVRRSGGQGAALIGASLLAIGPIVATVAIFQTNEEKEDNLIMGAAMTGTGALMCTLARINLQKEFELLDFYSITREEYLRIRRERKHVKKVRW